MLVAHKETTTAPSDSLISIFSSCLTSGNVFSFPVLAIQHCIIIHFAHLCGYEEVFQVQENGEPIACTETRQ